MKLTEAQVRGVLCGAHDLEQVNGAWQVHHMPREMLPVWDTSRLQIRVRCTTGVRLRFISNTRQVRLAVRYGANSRPFFQGSLVLNGGAPQAWGPAAETAAWEGVVHQAEGGAAKENTFDVWFPNMVQTDLVAVELDAQATLKPAPALAGKWLALGDSITQGMISTQPALMWAAKCALALNLELINTGIGGAMIDPRMAECVPGGQYKLITVAFGTNEWYNSIPPGAFGYNAKRLLDALAAKHPKTPVVLITPPTMAGEDKKPNTQEQVIQKYRDVLGEAARGRAGVHVVNGRELLPDAEGEFTDGIHPNDHGMELYAAKLLPHLQKVLQA